MRSPSVEAGPADLYRPVAALPGTEDWYPLPAAQVAQRSISAAAIEDAIALRR
jgi:hypothetical protein